MIQDILAPGGVSITDLKKNPSAVIEAAAGFPVAIFNRNRPSAYLVPAEAWEAIMERLDDLELAEIVKQRREDDIVEISIDDL